MNEQKNCSLLLKYARQASFPILLSLLSAIPVFAALTPHKALKNHNNSKIPVDPGKTNHATARANFPLPINPAPPVITLPSPQTFTTGTAITPIRPTNTGGVVPATAYGVSTFAGTGAIGNADGPGKTASFNSPTGVVSDASGNIYETDQNNNSVRKITPSGVVSIIAGSGAIGKTDGVGTAATFYHPAGLDVDSSGNIYVADYANNLIRKIDKTGIVTTLAGSGASGSANGTGTAASFTGPLDVKLDKAGNVYVADDVNSMIRKITPAGVVTTFAGSPIIGHADGTGTAATFYFVSSLVFDSNGNMFVVDLFNYTIRKITPAGVVTTFAGSGVSGTANGKGTAASFNAPYYITIDKKNNLYVTDYKIGIIRKIDTSGVVSNFAGNGTVGAINGLPTIANFNTPIGLTTDTTGNVYVADARNNVIRKVTITGYAIDKILPSGLTFDATTGTISGTPTVLSPATNYTITAYNTGGSSSATISITTTGSMNFGPISPKVYGTADFIPAKSTTDSITYTSSNPAVATIVSGLVHIRSIGKSIITAKNGTTTIAQPLIVTPAPLSIIADNKSKNYNAPNPVLTVSYDGFVNGDTNASLTNQPVLTTEATTSSLPGSYIINMTTVADTNYTINYVTGTLTVLGGKTILIAPLISYAGGPQAYAAGTAINPFSPANAGGAVPTTVYGLTSTFAGTVGVRGAQNGTGTAATLYAPNSIAIDGIGNLYIPDQNNLIRKITPGAVVSTLAGSGATGTANGAATTASFNDPEGIAADSAGNVYITESSNQMIRKITSAGFVSIFVGQASVTGHADGTGTGATFNDPVGLTTDKDGNIYVADYFNYLVRKVTPSGVVTTVAGLAGIAGATNGPVATATLQPRGCAVDRLGNIYVADAQNNLIRKITPAGLVSTFAGTGLPGSNDGVGTSASVNSPFALTADAAGDIFVADAGNVTIRKITPGGLVTTIAGTAGVTGSNDGAGPAASFRSITGIVIDTAGNLFVSDVNNAIVKKVITTGYSIDKTLPPGLTFDSKTGIISGTPTAASPATNYIITGNNVSGGSTAIVNIKVAGDAGLFSLNMSSGALSPAFVSATTAYTATVSNATSSITVTPTLNDVNASLTVNGVTQPSGNASAAIPLNIGNNIIKVLVTASDSTTIRIYTLTVKRPSTNADLASLTISQGTLSPAFSAATTSYSASVDNSISSITVTPALSDVNATLKVNGVTQTSGSASASIPLVIGNNTVAVVTTAQDGIASKTYSINVTRAAATTSNASLSSLTVSAGTLSPGFTSGTAGYTASVGNSTSSITITPSASNGNTLTVNGVSLASGSTSSVIPLIVGSNNITVVATAQDGSTKTYTIIVTRAIASDAGLASLSISSGTLSPAFSTGISNYAASVDNTISSISLTPALSDVNATVSVNGVALASGSPSAAIPLNIGSNVITVAATAQDGTTTNAYTVTVTRAIPDIYSLPANNFKLTITSATCKGTADGMVNITAVQNLNYSATISGNGLNTSYPFSTTLNITDLAAGTYSVCITADGQTDYKQCFDVVITEPQDLSVYSTINDAGNSLTLALNGGSQYNIQLNGATYTTTNSSITLPLIEGDNELSVTTDRLCQGAIQRSIHFAGKISPYPVPFQNTLNLNIGNSNVTAVLVEIHDISDGRLVYSKQYANQSGVLQLDVTNLKEGSYALHLSLDNSEKIYKIIKK